MKKFYTDFTFTVVLLPWALCTNPLLCVETPSQASVPWLGGFVISFTHMSQSSVIYMCTYSI